MTGAEPTVLNFWNLAFLLGLGRTRLDFFAAGGAEPAQFFAFAEVSVNLFLPCVVPKSLSQDTARSPIPLATLAFKIAMFLNFK